MARFRIVKRGSPTLIRGRTFGPVFDVEERCLFWWEPRGTCATFAEAELRVIDLKMATPIKSVVVKEYD